MAEENLTKAELQEKVTALEEDIESKTAQLEANKETLKHIETVQNYLNKCISNLIERSNKHDQSKLATPEVEVFAKYTPILKDLTYGSKEYNKCLEEMKPALHCHYNKNDHHPEFFPNGINDMDFLNILEMICDWISTTERQHDGNILKSLDENVQRFGIDEQLATIIRNTLNKIMRK